jgi:NADH dehydrogenase [ubiquinone] 1 alpha subcomplex assembly factor 5
MSRDLPFDRGLRRLRRDRAALRRGEPLYFHDTATEGLLERLDGVQRSFPEALVIGGLTPQLEEALRSRGSMVTVTDASAHAAARAGGVQCDEDRLPFADASFDLVVSVGALDSVNDLPGALILIRRILRPDRLFLAACAGAGSLPSLKRAMLSADEAAGGAVTAHVHPQIDVRAMGDLLARAGFLLPVADREQISLRYRSFARLVADLRAEAATNILVSREGRALGRAALAAAAADFESRGGEEQVELLFLTGWAPPR